MNSLTKDRLFKRNTLTLADLLEKISLPKALYNKAVARYKGLGQFLANAESLAEFEPRIFCQGSFALGTAIRPINKDDDYDIDLACSLEAEVSVDDITQQQLKKLVGRNLKDYADQNNIEKPIKNQKRCWTIKYSDHENYHMDILPCIPNYSETDLLSITDKRHYGYENICSDWYTSNPEKYALWFRKKSTPASRSFLDASVADVPFYLRKNVLQNVVMLLKRHRDIWCIEYPEYKPASIIITTLAADAYGGQGSVWDALSIIIPEIRNFAKGIDCDDPIILNPVNRDENFAENWTVDGEYFVFQKWVEILYHDLFTSLSNDNDDSEFTRAYDSLGISFGDSISTKLKSQGIMLGAAVGATNYKPHRIDEGNAPSPWGSGKSS